MDKIKLESIPGKGMGYVATEFISADEIIFAEKPFALVGSSDHKSIYSLLYVVMQSKKTKKIFETFAPHEVDDTMEFVDPDKLYIRNACIKKFMKSLPNLTLYCEKIHRNVFSFNKKLMLLNHGTRFNHSCVPNVHYFFDDNEKCMYFVAIRDICEGDELTIAYIDGVCNQLESLKVTYGFDCRCPKHK
jgi:hypothetical protein